MKAPSKPVKKINNLKTEVAELYEQTSANLFAMRELADKLGDFQTAKLLKFCREKLGSKETTYSNCECRLTKPGSVVNFYRMTKDECIEVLTEFI
jgi:DNA-nicking Smr family endonuclease